jgi:hypothetical protein
MDMAKERSHTPKDDMRNTSEHEKADTVVGGLGGLGGLAAGAAGGLVLGPVGAVVGALAGVAGGWWAGKQVVDAAADFDAETDSDYRRVHESTRAGARAYDEVRHAYQLGHLAGRNPDYRDAGFDRIEPDLRRAWVDVHGAADEWDLVRPYVDRGFERARERHARE